MTPIPRPRRETLIALVDFIVRALLTLAVFVLAVEVGRANDHARGLDDGIACRSRVNAEVDGLSDEITAKTSQIFVSGIANDDATVAELGRDLELLSKRMYPAIERRNKAAENCRR